MSRGLGDVYKRQLSKELEFIEKTYGIRDEELPLMMKNALDVAFADDAVKERIFRQMV